MATAKIPSLSAAKRSTLCAATRVYVECIEQSLIGCRHVCKSQSRDSPLTLLSFRKGVKPLRNLLVAAAPRYSYKQIPPFGRNDKVWKRFFLRQNEVSRLLKSRG
jgi:hypothetical protein